MVGKIVTKDIFQILLNLSGTLNVSVIDRQNFTLSKLSYKPLIRSIVEWFISSKLESSPSSIACKY